MNWSRLCSALWSKSLRFILTPVTTQISRTAVQRLSPSSWSRRFCSFSSPKQFHNQNYSKFILISGVMSFLGLEKEKEEKDDELIMTLKRSVLLMQQGDLAKAEQMLHLALRLAQERMSVDGITYTYDLMANLALERGELAKAEKLFLTVMNRLLVAGAQENDNKILHMSIKLANIFADGFFEGKDASKAQELCSKAHNGYDFCKERLQKKIDSGDNDSDTYLLLSLAYEGEGRLYAGQEMLPKARLSYEKALEWSKRGKDTDERMSSLLGYLGYISGMQAEIPAAMHYLEEAIAIARKNNGEQLQSMLVNLGMLKLYNGALAEARNSCKEGFNLSRQAKDSETENEAVRCLEEVNVAFKNKK
ncbi:tetratricopeptide repeat protein 19 homolog, mitochondrial-like [Cloeon dipterum]|uniref:tetratricopeptide repeat protein 19 homolog, mitochondrial-like n=1 Tax=Cloeon dipterum TaxID=197152 RepID=UPI00321F8F60